MTTYEPAVTKGSRLGLTLETYILEGMLGRPEARGHYTSLLSQLALAAKLITARVRRAGLADVLGYTGDTNIQGEQVQKLDVEANETIMRILTRRGVVAAAASEEEDEMRLLSSAKAARYLVVFDPLDGSSNIDINGTAGSIFSILRAPEPGVDATTQDFLQPGTAQVCAGYALYGPATMLVLTVGRGVHAFTLDRALGEFVLTRESIRVPRPASEFAINASNRRFWEPAVRRYVDECLTGRSGPRHKDFNMRWVASLVAETHRILTRGGVFLYPRDTKDPAKPGRLRLLYEANPVAFLIEQAGGAASTGRERVLDVIPSGLHQRCPLIFGAEDEVALIDRYHQQHNDRPYDSPLYGDRGLFRVGTG
jgi:fructose-1,6-bisphosphatase I/sedoheptulose-1,7-bisphosphatase